MGSAVAVDFYGHKNAEGSNLLLSFTEEVAVGYRIEELQGSGRLLGDGKPRRLTYAAAL